MSIAGIIGQAWVQYPRKAWTGEDVACWVLNGLLVPSKEDLEDIPEDYDELTELADKAITILTQHKWYFEWATNRLVRTGAVHAGLAWTKMHGPWRGMGPRKLQAHFDLIDRHHAKFDAV